MIIFASLICPGAFVKVVEYQMNMAKLQVKISKLCAIFVV